MIEIAGGNFRSQSVRMVRYYILKMEQGRRKSIATPLSKN